MGDEDQTAFLPKEQVLLEEGEQIRGTFWIAEREVTTATAGVLRWSRAAGAELWLINAPLEWPGIWHGSGYSDEPLTVHGTSAAAGKKISMLHAYIASSSFGSGAAQIRLISQRLILFRHCTEEDRWKRLLMRTANLHEWLPITGFGQADLSMDRRFQVRGYGLTWKAPRGKRVELPDAKVHFHTRMLTNPSPWRPKRVIRTTMDITVTPDERKTLREFHEDYVTPLRDLITIAGGIPDSLLYESVTIGKQPPAVVLEKGIQPISRDWPRPDRQLLFYGLDIPDFRVGLKKWFALHDRVSPAFEYFAESINEDEYSRDRLLSIASTLETYHRSLYDPVWRRTYKRRNPSKKQRRPTLLERIAHLQRLSGIPERSTGLTKARRELFVASRNHFAHLDQPRYGYSIEDIFDSAIPTIARGVALMHACIMRQLGFPARQTKERIDLMYGRLVRQ